MFFQIWSHAKRKPTWRSRYDDLQNLFDMTSHENPLWQHTPWTRLPTAYFDQLYTTIFDKIVGTKLRCLSYHSLLPGTVLKHQIMFLRHWSHLQWDRGAGRESCIAKGPIKINKIRALPKSKFQILFQLILSKIVVSAISMLWEALSAALIFCHDNINAGVAVPGICSSHCSVFEQIFLSRGVPRILQSSVKSLGVLRGEGVETWDLENLSQMLSSPLSFQ